MEQFIHRQNLGHYRRLLADPDEKSLSWRVVTRGFDDHRPGAGGCISQGVGGYVVDCVRRYLRPVDQDVSGQNTIDEWSGKKDRGPGCHARLRRDRYRYRRCGWWQQCCAIPLERLCAPPELPRYWRSASATYRGAQGGANAAEASRGRKNMNASKTGK